MPAVFPSLLAPAPVLAEHAYSPEELRNREIVLAFYHNALNEKDFDAASKYLGTCIQHNPVFPGGPGSLHKFIGSLKKDDPNSRSQIVRVIVDVDKAAWLSNSVAGVCGIVQLGAA
ncbi:hypothetical protein HGP17_14505 [Rhizobium sp. P38BS-XIX]|uniref:nuclear transport factor 2 family protein n=1 Tax=Rhizobium sp. P38BS-XIX TaxID=2726740 RepID=UPI00145728FC|nr:hypothetical protein [Rhizobium sp. P38BS-XIX]NLR98028.1 hypothetical protein [Rhizobium sp. P38BS-XIX]